MLKYYNGTASIGGKFPDPQQHQAQRKRKTRRSDFYPRHDMQSELRTQPLVHCSTIFHVTLNTDQDLQPHHITSHQPSPFTHPTTANRTRHHAQGSSFRPRVPCIFQRSVVIRMKCFARWIVAFFAWARCRVHRFDDCVKARHEQVLSCRVLPFCNISRAYFLLSNLSKFAGSDTSL